jgi:hypothetical protein
MEVAIFSGQKKNFNSTHRWQCSQLLGEIRGEGEGGQGGEMTQTIYAHVNK